jgi:hypothetical protein
MSGRATARNYRVQTDQRQATPAVVPVRTGREWRPSREIDVLVGDLHGRVTIWQAKYFIRGIGRAQTKQIRESFASAIKAADANGYTVARWVLCIPSRKGNTGHGVAAGFVGAVGDALPLDRHGVARLRCDIPGAGGRATTLLPATSR